MSAGAGLKVKGSHTEAGLRCDDARLEKQILLGFTNLGAYEATLLDDTYLPSDVDVERARI